MNFNYFEISKVGSREINQDYFAHQIFEEAACFVVADGLGGHPKGEVASKEFCEALMTLAPNFYKQKNKTRDTIQHWIEQSAQDMREPIFKKEGAIDPHTTFVLVWIDTKQVISAHVGDSRLYRFSSTQPLWRTPDHTLVQEQFDKGMIKENDFLGHPLQNCLLRTVNLNYLPRPDIFIQPPLEKDEVLLLCTDGFWPYLTEENIKALSDPKKGKMQVEEKIEEILKMNPKHADNITVQWIVESL